MLLNTIIDRIEIASNGCFLWVGPKDQRGYGRQTYLGVGYLAHRLVYEYLVESIQEGLVLDHLCENKSCVNPDHLEPVTQAENVSRYFRTNPDKGVTRHRNGYEARLKHDGKRFYLGKYSTKEAALAALTQARIALGISQFTN